MNIVHADITNLYNFGEKTVLPNALKYRFIQVALTVVLLAILRVALVTLPTQVMTKAADKPLSSVNLSSPFCRSAPGSNRIG